LAQLGYTVPFTLVHAGKYRTEDQLKVQTIQKLNTSKQHKTQLNKTTLVQSPFTTIGRETTWAYSTNTGPNKTRSNLGKLQYFRCTFNKL